jgi:hypothetical protein
MAATGPADSYRQAGFVLGDEIDHVLEGLDLEGACADASSGAKFRNQVVASALGLWSRAWLSRLEALHALEWGNYIAAMPLIRTAADHQAAALLLLQTNASEWDEWLDTNPIGLAPGDHATEFRPHAFRAGEILAAHPILGPVYRASTALSLPHFETTLLLAGADSTPERILMTFGDRDFHLGLGEVVLGWLLQLGIAQFDALAESEGVLAMPGAAAIETWRAHAGQLLARDDRCVVEPVERDGMPRLLVRNWRRTPGAAKKKVLL